MFAVREGWFRRGSLTKHETPNIRSCKLQDSGRKEVEFLSFMPSANFADTTPFFDASELHGFTICSNQACWFLEIPPPCKIRPVEDL